MTDVERARQALNAVRYENIPDVLSCLAERFGRRKAELTLDLALERLAKL